MNKTCETCRFAYCRYTYESVLEGKILKEPVFECRIRSVPQAEFPERYTADWCGEWKAKDEPEKNES
jgi:hypothetical protein